MSNDQVNVDLEPGQQAVVHAAESSEDQSADESTQAAPEKHLLEGKEIQGKIGDFGSYDLDVDTSGNVDATAQLAYEKQLISWCGVKASMNVEVKADLVGAALAWGSASSNSIVKKLAAKLSVLTGRV